MNGYSLGRSRINIICDADDTVQITEIKMIYRALCSNSVLHVLFSMTTSSTQKRKIMTIAIESVRCNMMVDNIIIEEVMEFSYLVILITSSQQLKKEVNV